MPLKPIAIALCRVSSLEQLDNNSLHRQRESVMRAADELGLTIPEDGWWSGSVSSKKGTNVTRKDLQEMLERCKKNKHIKYVIVDEVDRFMRSMLEIGYFLIEFKKLGVKVIFASQPDLKTDTATDTLLLMLEAFKAEGSNEERQRKSISGQTKALQEGKYPFSPKPGYKRGYQRGVQEVHPKRGPALKKVLIRVASRLVTPTQGLIELNQSDFMSDGHSLYKMDKFRKIVTDPFYAGIVEINKQVKLRNENGLHEPLITKEQHQELVWIMEGKKKNQGGPRKNGNPEYPLSNYVTCELCKDIKYGRYVGFKHSNGKNVRFYHKYRCRSCKRYLSRGDLHSEVERYFNERSVTQNGIDALVKAIDIVWRDKAKQAIQDSNRINRQIDALNRSIDDHVEAVTDPSNAAIKENIIALIEKKKGNIARLEEEVFKIKNEVDNDKDRFLRFALNFAKNTGSRFLEVSAENRQRCKLILFPAGFYLDEKNKVYTPEISLIYGLATTKKGAEAPNNSHLVRVRRL